MRRAGSDSEATGGAGVGGLGWHWIGGLLVGLSMLLWAIPVQGDIGWQGRAVVNVLGISVYVAVIFSGVRVWAGFRGWPRVVAGAFWLYGIAGVVFMVYLMWIRWKWTHDM